jgi:tryptophan synthase alpha chain
MTTDRYGQMFATIAQERRIALIPFLMIGDPDEATFMHHVDGLVAAGADALELGFPYSDPVADGPTVVAAARRALASGSTPARCFDVLHAIRERHPQLPLGLLVYANLVYARGLDGFYRDAAAAGVDSVLVPDAPLREVAPFIRVADGHGIEQVLIVPPDVSDETLARIAESGAAYSYVLGRKGVTGTHQAADAPLAATVARLHAAGAPPPVVGFGINSAAAVRAARDAGAAGVIVGSALIEALTAGEEAGGFLRPLAEATRR